MTEQNKHNEDARKPGDERRTPDIPEHMKPENLERLRDYGKDKIPPGVA